MSLPLLSNQISIRKLFKASWVAIACTTLAAPVLADTYHMTSLEWPPYSGAKLDNQGASIAVAKAAFKAMGHDLVVEFFPWSRSVKMAQKDGSKYIGYFPEYFYETEDFHFSEVMGSGPLGFVEAKKKPISWEKVADIKNYKIGVVQDYVNTKELDDMIAKGEIKAEAVVSDDKNVLKVAGGRLDAAVIDSNVLDYLKLNSKPVRRVSKDVQMNKKLLVDKKLYVAFKNTKEGRAVAKIFNEGLKKIDIDAIMKENMKE